MPTTQRLLTDETGQALVTAINNIVAAVKPNATEIQMGANDTTTVAEAINSTNQALSNDVLALKIGTDIPRNTDFNTLITPGNYRVRSYSDSATMTNIPIARAGTLYVKNGMLESGANYIQQIYVTFDNNIYIRYSENKGSAWSTWEQLSTKGDWTGASAYKEQIESSANCTIQMFGKVRVLSFQGVSREHTESEVLMTLPSEHRPVGGNSVYAVGTVGSTPVVIRLDGGNGQVLLYIANNARAGRIYFNMTWVAA